MSVFNREQTWLNRWISKGSCHVSRYNKVRLFECKSIKTPMILVPHYTLVPAMVLSTYQKHGSSTWCDVQVPSSLHWVPTAVRGLLSAETMGTAAHSTCQEQALMCHNRSIVSGDLRCIAGLWRGQSHRRNIITTCWNVPIAHPVHVWEFPVVSFSTVRVNTKVGLL